MEPFEYSLKVFGAVMLVIISYPCKPDIFSETYEVMGND